MTFDVAIVGDSLFAGGDLARGTATVMVPAAEGAIAGTAVDASLAVQH